MKKRVGFRLLQLILSHVSGDRVSLALLHWDGERLRVASSLSALTALTPGERDGVQASVLDIVREATSIAHRLETSPQPSDELTHVFPVREGFGAALYWTPVTTVHTSDSEGHFDALVRELHLDREPDLDRNEQAARSCPVAPGPCPSDDTVHAPPPGMPALTTSCRG